MAKKASVVLVVLLLIAVGIVQALGGTTYHWMLESGDDAYLLCANGDWQIDVNGADSLYLVCGESNQLPQETVTQNLITNPNFDTPERGFDGWQTGGCISYVRPPKEGAAKAGPTVHDGLCLPGDVAVISQTFTIPTATTTISLTYREIIKGAGNHLVVSLADGNGWTWTVQDTIAQTGGTGFYQMPMMSATVPEETTQLTLRVEAHYQAGIGMKFTSFEVKTGN